MGASPWYEWGAIELSPIAKDNAQLYLESFEERVGRQLSASEWSSMFDPQLKAYERLESHAEREKHDERISIIRAWVKAVAPLLGKAEAQTDGPLHKVLDWAEDILGMSRVADQDVHPHHATKVIIPMMRRWTNAVLVAQRERGLKG